MKMDSPISRAVGDLTSPEAARHIKDASVLCLPLGAIEQHGPHLPLNTDVIVAEELTRRIVARWGDTHDLWQLPTLSVGLSREHDWAPGTLSLSIQSFVALLCDLARDLVRALPARNLLIVNGHGGNRGVLDILVHELTGDFGLNACVVHPFDLSQVRLEGIDVHGGAGETAVMLALAPQRVRMDAIAPQSVRAEEVAALIFDRGVSYPWRTDDPRLTANGVIGDPAAATPGLGEAIVDSIVGEVGRVLERLRANDAARRAGARAVSTARQAT
ncbi:MAG: creatininase family protein [Hyphomicrobiales bacterium]|nr:creatininase family protein [Hyphomicrobiales bacterium]